jgi:predicted porin
MLEAQRLRLEALEKKLDAVGAAKAATPAQGAFSAMHGELGAPGEGYSFHITPQDTVTLYGLLDLSLVDRNHATTAGGHSRNMEIGWFSGSRWGITGYHGIGGDSRVIFKLESEIELPTGAEDTPGVLFNRDAWVGFQSDTFGKLTLGRQNALPRDITAIYGDPYSGPRVTLEEGGYTNSNNFKQLIFYAASATGTRYDRGVVWKKEFGPLVAGLAYQFGGVAGNMEEGSTQAVALGFNGPGDVFHLAGYYTQFQVGGFDHKDWSIGGNVVLSPIFRINAGYYKDDTEQPAPFGKRKDHAWTVSTKIAPPGPMDFELGYQTLHADNAAVNASGNLLVPYRDTGAARGTATGDKKTLYGSIFYHFDRRAEVYLAADYAKLSGGYKLGSFNGFANQTEVATGMRIRF